MEKFSQPADENGHVLLRVRKNTESNQEYRNDHRIGRNTETATESAWEYRIGPRIPMFHSKFIMFNSYVI